MNKIFINREPVELYKILKFEGLAASGAEAKAAIHNSEVMVNGVIETRKRNKIMQGTTIDYNGERYQIVLGDEE